MIPPGFVCSIHAHGTCRTEQVETIRSYGWRRLQPRDSFG
jgi:hypothetical protein